MTKAQNRLEVARITALAAALMGVYGVAQGTPFVSYNAGPSQSVVVPDSAIANGGTTSVITAKGAGATVTFDSPAIQIDWNGANASNTSNAALRAINGGAIEILGGTINTSGTAGDGKVRKTGIQAVDGGTVTAGNVTINTTGGFSPGVQAYRTYSNPTAGDTPTAVNLNGVTINTGGTYSVGIRSDHKGAGVAAVDTDINTTGDTSYGVEVDDGATVQLTNGSIATSGASAAGVRAYTGTGAMGQLGAGVATVSGTTINTSGAQASGLLAGDSGEPSAGIINASNATITTTGDYAAALESAYGSTVTSTNGELRTEGLYGYGAYAHDGGAIVIDGGSLTTANATGKGTQDGDGSRAYALYATGAGSSVAAKNGVAILTEGQRAYGAYAANGGSVDITGGSIATNGFMAYGAYSSGSGSTVTTRNTNITTTGDVGDAVWAYQGGVTNVNGGVIDVGGSQNVNAPHETANGLVAVGGDGTNTAGTINATGITLMTRGVNSIGVLAGGDIGSDPTTGIVNLNSSSIANLALGGGGRGIEADYLGSSVAGANNTIRVAGSGTGWGDMPVAVAASDGAQINLSGGVIAATGAQYTRGILATTGASVTTTNTAISTTGDNSHAVQAWSSASGAGSVPTITINGGTITTAGDNSWGLYSQNTGSITSTANITTSGLAGFGAFAEEGASLTLNGGSITTTGGALNGTIGSFGVLSKNGSTVNVNNVAIKTSGALADGLRSDRDGSETGGSIIATNTIINTGGVKANGIGVYGGGGGVAMTGGGITTTGTDSAAAYLQNSGTVSLSGTTLSSAGATLASSFTQAGQAQSITLGAGTTVAANNGELLRVTRSGAGTDGTVALALQAGSFAQGNVYDTGGAAGLVMVSKTGNAQWAGLVVDAATQTLDGAGAPPPADYSTTQDVLVTGSAPVTFTGTTSVGSFSGATGGSTTFSGPATVTGELIGAQGSSTSFSGPTSIGQSVTGASGSTIAFTGASTTIGGGVSGTQGTHFMFSQNGPTTIGGPIQLSGAGASTHGGTLQTPIVVHGDVTVGEGATLGGNIISSGALGGAGGTVAPGNSVGRQEYASSAGFTGNYFAEVNAAGKSDLIVITSGNFDLSGIGLTVGQENGNGGYVLNHDYTIVQTPGGQVQNQFSSAALNDSFAGTLVRLDPVKYEAQDVKISLSVNTGAVATERARLTANQNATLDGVLSVAGRNTAADAALQSTAPGTALNQLSGEVHASTSSALIASSGLVQRTLTQRMQDNLGAGLSAGAPLAQAGGAVPAGALPAPQAQPLWAQVVGNWNTLSSDGNAAKVRTDMGGLFVGGDAAVGSGWRVGGALGFTDGRINVDDRSSHSTVRSYTASVYGGNSWAAGQGKVNFVAGAAYTWHDLSSRRSVTLGGPQTLRADYAANSAQLFTELGYALPLGAHSVLEPYAGLAWLTQHTQGFTESGGAAALSGQSHTDGVTTFTLGLRGKTELRWGADKAVTLSAGLGWRHASGDVSPGSTLAFLQGGGSAFRVSGAPIAKDAAVVEAGVQAQVGRQTSLGLSYSGQYGGGSTDHAGMLFLRTRF